MVPRAPNSNQRNVSWINTKSSPRSGGGHTGQHDNRAMPEITSDSGNDPLPTAPIQHELKRKPRYFLGTFWLAITVLLGAVGFTNPAGAWWCILLAIATFAYSIYLYRGGRYGFWFF